MDKKRCVNCGCKFFSKKHILNQRYCSNKTCQNARKANWRRNKLRRNKKSRFNKKKAQDKWKTKNPDYWKNYKINTPKEKPNDKKTKKLTLKISLPKSILVNPPKSDSIKSDCRVVFTFI